MGEEAIDLYRQMPENIRNTVTHMCVLNACSHAGLVDQARLIFDRITNKTEKVIVTMVRSQRLTACSIRSVIFPCFRLTHSPAFSCSMRRRN